MVIGDGRQGRKTKEKLSTNPAAIRARLRKKTKYMEEDLEILYETQGYKPLDQWDLEELARGRPKLPNGTWKPGSKPSWITGKVQAEIHRRLLEEGEAVLASHLGSAIKVMADMMVSKEKDINGKPIVDASTKMQCAKFIIEKVLGKANQAITLQTDESFRDFLAAALVLPGGVPAHPVIEGTAVEADDDSDDNL